MHLGESNWAGRLRLDSCRCDGRSICSKYNYWTPCSWFLAPYHRSTIGCASGISFFFFHVVKLFQVYMRENAFANVQFQPTIADDCRTWPESTWLHKSRCWYCQCSLWAIFYDPLASYNKSGKSLSFFLSLLQFELAKTMSPCIIRTQAVLMISYKESRKFLSTVFSKVLMHCNLTNSSTSSFLDYIIGWPMKNIFFVKRLFSCSI